MVESEASKLDLIFQALSDPTRRTILQTVSKRDRTVGEIAKPFRMSLAAVSKHLQVLERAKLIERKKEGSFQIISLSPGALKKADQWISYYEQFWDRKLDHLKKFIEEEIK